ncbi:juvenile hormone esterase-like [Pectinophora gossypiella]|uniref:juvenile hormone esterase-like n=1 Tax=Pectinophora gossypiella TaxID=13191 RepID=UPI00214F0FB0|nr:juvenile hormone esterase-like [Pectinophora gossypiella]
MEECEVRARTSAGWVCGARRWSEYGGVYYASFRGVPYARQPLGELRFKELQAPESWDHLLDATNEGDICPQTDVLYGPLMRPRGMSEACIHANIHVPISALPRESQVNSSVEEAPNNATGLSILVFIHGGVLAFGSGDSDLHGPEYLVSHGVIVITFNYRLNVFGFLSLNSTKIPGNNGLRDMITLLRWVRDNARNFGGNPDDVTLGGQSAGAVSAHLLTLSPEAQGLFKRTILMSGTAMPVFFTTSPLYAQSMANAFITGLGINSTDPDDIHQQLLKMPLEKIMEMNKLLQDQNGLGVFYPVVESRLPGVKRILSDDPELLLQNGTGNDIPLLLGFTDVEAETFRKRFEEIDMVSRINDNPLVVVSPTVTTSVPTQVAFARAMQIEQRYFNGTPSMDQYVKLVTEQFFHYTALKVADYRSRTDGAPVFLYQFPYDADFSLLRTALGVNYTGAAHIEDMTYLFHCNSVRVPYSDSDYDMKRLMNQYVVNFMRYSHPAPDSSWQPVDRDGIRYLELHSAAVQHLAELTPDQRSMLDFFDGIMARDQIAV